MAMVQGEDTESDEEINTDQIHSLSLTPDGTLTTIQPDSQNKATGAGIVPGEESETDEEDEVPVGGKKEAQLVPPGSQTASVSPGTSQRSSVESNTPPPQSLLHKKLRETNVDLRRRIVNRILRLYRTTCYNLTTVNDNLSKAQGLVEKVNSQLKQSDRDLEQTNTLVALINKDSQALAPNIRIELPPASPSRRSLFKRSPEKSKSPPSNSKSPEKPEAPEPRTESPTAITNLSHDPL